jgi:hypothetical protein
MVVEPSSDFFKYMKDAGRRAAQEMASWGEPCYSRPSR